MKRTRRAWLLAPLLLLPALALGTLAVAGADQNEPVTIEIPLLRVGDSFTFNHTTAAQLNCNTGECLFPEGIETRTFIGRVASGWASGVDRYGIPRQTETFLEERWLGEALEEAAVCHRLPYGVEAIRRDIESTTWLAGSGRAQSSDHVQLETVSGSYRAVPTTTFYGGTCLGVHGYLGSLLREGDRIDLRRLVGDDGRDVGDILSSPAQATSFHGRPALAFDFSSDSPGSRVKRYVLADGIPVIVRSEVMDAPVGRPYLNLLVGFRQGAGAFLTPLEGGRLPDINPRASLVPYSPLVVDDAAYGFAYRAQEAWDALMADPRGNLAPFLASRPGAYIARWEYSVSGYSDLFRHGASDGAWTFEVAHEGRFIFIRSERGALLDVPAALKVTENLFLEESEGLETIHKRPDMPDLVPDSYSLLAAAVGGGVDANDMPGVMWSVSRSQDGRPNGFAVFSSGAGWRTGETEDGVGVHMDPLAAGATSILAKSREVRREPLVSLGERPEPLAAGSPASASGFGLLAESPRGIQLSAAAAGIGLLALLVAKLLLPLYTRLGRNRVLDHPVRARLYEQVRSEPGIRQGQIVDFLGIGDGAARRHIEVLRRHGFIVEARLGGLVGYYVTGDLPPRVARQALLLQSDGAKRVHDLLRREPHLSLREAARRLGMTAPGVHRHRKRLREAGLLGEDASFGVAA